MTDLFSLLLPIVLSSVAVFFVSSFIHMVSPWHKNDYPRLKDEARVMDALRPFAIPPGDYMIPRPASREDLRSPEYSEKLNNGPVVVMTICPTGPIAMGKNLAFWFIYSMAIGIFSAYITGRALPIGSEYLQVFRFVGATAFLGYSAALWQMSIWYNRSWSTTVKATIDGLIYALSTAGIFAWLWPR
ncbi:MAG TPA: hypothetical protein VMW43_04150 [Bacteroidota bacterium]|nr:hypothetical protein [Bacteroidota bacterium]